MTNKTFYFYLKNYYFLILPYLSTVSFPNYLLHLGKIQTLSATACGVQQGQVFLTTTWTLLLYPFFFFWHAQLSLLNTLSFFHLRTFTLATPCPWMPILKLWLAFLLFGIYHLSQRSHLQWSFPWILKLK